MKRKLEDVNLGNDSQGDVSEQFLTQCEEKFRSNPANTISRNAINAVGSMIATTNSNRVNEISHVFLNSVKKKNLKATNQGASGRCWMFSALNTFRHILINALQLEDFEFSEVYLFFWDKLERSNSYLRWFIEHPEEPSDGRAFEYMVSGYLSDGGWWNTFANLANKYGIVPHGTMKETYQSDDSEDMNRIITEQLDSAVNHILKNRCKLTIEQQEEIRRDTVKNIYDTLVKFLGEPPKTFSWSFTNEEGITNTLDKMSPKQFLEMVAPEVDMNKDFATLGHVPKKGMKYYQNYRIKYTNNVAEGECCTIFNVPIEELSKYAIESISNGMAVWFVGDVSKSFNWFHSALDDCLDDHKSVFSQEYEFEKGDRITMRNVQGNHALCLTGFNLDSRGKPLSWQVENSWGYRDNETPGQDGFLFMSHSWFQKYVVQLCVHKRFLSRTMQKRLNTPPIEIMPWDSLAPALRTNGMGVPHGYRELYGLKGRKAF